MPALTSLSSPSLSSPSLPALHVPCDEKALAKLLARLEARYAEPRRHYHTWAHVLACFAARDCLTSTPHPAVDLALLFHDAVYEPLQAPGQVGNEEASAALLLEEGRRAWIDEGTLQAAHALVLATRHGHHDAGPSEPRPCDDQEASIVLDADLSILGASPEAFERYERQVREEFHQVPAPAYAAGRARILRGFLRRPRIFLTARGERLWESAARRNLDASLASLATPEAPPA